MGKARRKFEIGFKRQVVEEIESGLITTHGAARKYEISDGVVERWKVKYRAGTLTDKPSNEEKMLKAENETWGQAAIFTYWRIYGDTYGVCPSIIS